MSLSVKRLVQFGRIISEGFDTNFEVMVNEDDNLDESKPSEIIYGGYPIIKQKLSERDLSREWIDMSSIIMR